MTEYQYRKYLKDLAVAQCGGDKDAVSGDFYGLFQRFMPEGSGVEKVFAPIAGGEAYACRIRPIYEVTAERVTASWNKGLAPGYFVPPPVPCTESDLQVMGNEILVGFRDFALFCGNRSLLQILDATREILLVDDVRDAKNSNDFIELYEAISDWAIRQSRRNDLLEVLGEAYYSIACNYWLSYHLQYPRYPNKPESEFLEPYFRLWKMGQDCALQDYKLLITHRQVAWN